MMEETHKLALRIEVQYPHYIVESEEVSISDVRKSLKAFLRDKEAVSWILEKYWEIK